MITRRTFLSALSAGLALLGLKPKPDRTAEVIDFLNSKPVPAEVLDALQVVIGEIELRHEWIDVRAGTFCYRGYVVSAVDSSGEPIEPGTPVYFENDGTVTTRPV